MEQPEAQFPEGLDKWKDIVPGIGHYAKTDEVGDFSYYQEALEEDDEFVEFRAPWVPNASETLAELYNSRDFGLGREEPHVLLIKDGSLDNDVITIVFVPRSEATDVTIIMDHVIRGLTQIVLQVAALRKDEYSDVYAIADALNRALLLKDVDILAYVDAANQWLDRFKAAKIEIVWVVSTMKDPIVLPIFHQLKMKLKEWLNKNQGVQQKALDSKLDDQPPPPPPDVNVGGGEEEEEEEGAGDPMPPAEVPDYMKAILNRVPPVPAPMPAPELPAFLPPRAPERKDPLPPMPESKPIALPLPKAEHHAPPMEAPAPMPKAEVPEYVTAYLKKQKEEKEAPVIIPLQMYAHKGGDETGEIEALKLMIHQLEESLRLRDKETNYKKEAADTLMNEAVAAKNEADAVKARLLIVEQDREITLKELKEVEREKADLERRFKEATANDANAKLIDDLNATIKTREDTIKTLEARLHYVSTSLTQKEAEMMQASASLATEKERSQSLEKMLKAEEQKTVQLTVSISDMSRDMDKLRNDKAKVESDIVVLRDHSRDLAADNQTARGALNTAIEENKTLTGENNKLKNDLIQRNVAIGDLHEELKKTKELLQKAEEDNLILRTKTLQTQSPPRPTATPPSTETLLQPPPSRTPAPSPPRTPAPVTMTTTTTTTTATPALEGMPDLSSQESPSSRPTSQRNRTPSPVVVPGALGGTPSIVNPKQEVPVNQDLLPDKPDNAWLRALNVAFKGPGDKTEQMKAKLFNSAKWASDYLQKGNTVEQAVNAMITTSKGTKGDFGTEAARARAYDARKEFRQFTGLSDEQRKLIIAHYITEIWNRRFKSNLNPKAAVIVTDFDPRFAQVIAEAIFRAEDPKNKTPLATCALHDERIETTEELQPFREELMRVLTSLKEGRKDEALKHATAVENMADNLAVQMNAEEAIYLLEVAQDDIRQKKSASTIAETCLKKLSNAETQLRRIFPS